MNLAGLGKPVVPKEHGAWAVLYGAFLVGLGVAGQVNLAVLLLLLGITAAAFANGALTMLLRPAAGQAHAGRKHRALAWSLVYGGLSMAALAPLLLVYRMIFLIPFGVGAALFLLVRGLLVRGRDDRTLVGEILGAAGLTMVGPVTHAVAAGEVRPIAALLWLLLFLFFANGVFYVRMRVQGLVALRKGAPPASNSAWWPCVLYHTLLILVVPALSLLRIVPWPVLLAFAPAVWRAAAGLNRDEVQLDLRRLGWSEVALTAAFVLLLIGAFHLSPVVG